MGRTAGVCSRRCLDAAERLVEETGGRSLAPQILELCARVASSPDGVAELLGRAHAVYLEIGAAAHARRVEAELR